MEKMPVPCREKSKGGITYMGRLTKRDRQGNWCIKGLPWKDIQSGNRWITF